MDRETRLTSNRCLAEDSLARRPRLNNGKLQLAEKYRELSNLATTCWEKQSQLGEFSPRPKRQRRGSGRVRFLVPSKMPVDDYCQVKKSSCKCSCDDKVTGSNSCVGWVNMALVSEYGVLRDEGQLVNDECHRVVYLEGHRHFLRFYMDISKRNRKNNGRIHSTQFEVTTVFPEELLVVLPCNCSKIYKS